MSSAEPVTFELWKTVVPSYFLLTLNPKSVEGERAQIFRFLQLWTEYRPESFQWFEVIDGHLYTWKISDETDPSRIMSMLYPYTFLPFNLHGYMIVAPAQSRKKGNGQSAWAAPRGEKRGMAEVVEPAAKKQKTEDRDNLPFQGEGKDRKRSKNWKKHRKAFWRSGERNASWW